MSEIRKVIKSDISDLKSVLDSIDLFPTDMLEEMISDYFNNPETQDIWFTYLENDQAISIAYCAPEMLADGTYNLYAIGVKKGIQGKGIGEKMMQFIESELKSKGQRILIVETSGSEQFKATRNFYKKLNYVQEAVIRDFWSDGDDKVVFWKKLN